MLTKPQGRSAASLPLSTGSPFKRTWRPAEDHRLWSYSELKASINGQGLLGQFVR